MIFRKDIEKYKVKYILYIEQKKFQLIESLINSSSEFSLLIKLETLRIVTSL